jgi:hypothetical protein
MIFGVKEARDQLLEHGVVYTFRTTVHFDGKDWATDRRGGKKIADIDVKIVATRAACAYHLDPYAGESGFKSAEEWWHKIQEMHGPEPEGAIYKVTLLRAYK